MDSTLARPSRSATPATSVPGQRQRRLGLSAADRLVRQVQAIDAWGAARRDRERTLLAPGLNRQQRVDVSYEVEALRRTHEAIEDRCAHLLEAGAAALGALVPTAVIAHRHAWFVDTLALRLGEHGVAVLVRTGNGAEALGAVVAEQPDLVLLGDRLAMVPVDELMAQVRRFAPDTLLAVAASDARQAETWRAGSDAVFLRHQAPRDVADALSALCSSAA